MRAWIPIALAFACGGTPKPTTTPSRLTAKEIVQQASPAIVRVEIGEGDLRQTGTGFILDASGLIATNLHVVQGKTDIKVKLYGGDVYPVRQIAGMDRARDLALLKIQPAKALPTLTLGDSDRMAAGDQVVAIGNPLGVFDYSVSSGLVSQVRAVCTAEMVEKHRQNEARYKELLAKPVRTDAEDLELAELGCPQELKILQISAPISQGSSGGPLFNEKGEVVGVTTAIIAAGQNINLAIPTNYLKPIVAHPVAISLDEFARETAEPARPGDGEKVVRIIPDHPLSVFDGCKREQIEEVVKSIWDAIAVGAPLYNQGNHEACYRIYEGTATKYEQDAPCKGIQQAFADGLKRAATMESYKLKAWAMRDTFDGLTQVAKKWAATHGVPAPPAGTQPAPTSGAR